jgi:hypothetical protein
MRGGVRVSTPSSWLSQRSFARQQESLAKTREELSELSVTMRSRDRAVDMTVGEHRGAQDR